MKILRLRRRFLAAFMLLGITAWVSVHLWLAADHPAMAEIEKADLAALAGKIIVIDPGHGGIDSGAKYNSIEEKNLTLVLAQKIGAVLKNSGATVIFTREADIDFYTRGKGGKRNDLLKRIQIINNSGACLFISVHTNAIAGSRWSGAEVYYNQKCPENKQIAETMQTILQSFPLGNKRQIKQDSDILVLKDTNIPGVLLEAGFLSNPQEAAMLADSAYQQRMAECIAKALAYHFSRNVAR